MPVFDELLVKVAEGKTLDPLELEQFRQEAQVLGEVKNIVKSWQGADNKVLEKFLNLPIDTIYSSILEQDYATLTVEIPANYKHLLIMGSGRATGAGPSAQYILAQFNDDEGDNYDQMRFRASSGGLDDNFVDNQPGAAIGLVTEGGVTTDSATSFMAVIPHYGSNLWKTFFMLAARRGFVYLTGSTWRDTSKITKLTLLPVTDDFAAGFVFSVYGIR